MRSNRHCWSRTSHNRRMAESMASPDRLFGESPCRPRRLSWKPSRRGESGKSFPDWTRSRVSLSSKRSPPLSASSARRSRVSCGRNRQPASASASPSAPAPGMSPHCRQLRTRQSSPALWRVTAKVIIKTCTEGCGILLTHASDAAPRWHDQNSATGPVLEGGGSEGVQSAPLT